jgi:hypothetical protein
LLSDAALKSRSPGVDAVEVALESARVVVVCDATVAWPGIGVVGSAMRVGADAGRAVAATVDCAVGESA